MLWLAIGWIMVTRYCFLIQRGWTEKEKVARKRARRRNQVQEQEEDPMQRKITCGQRLKFVSKFLFMKRPKSIFTSIPN